MKKIVLNIMATTGITLVVLALIATCFNATFIRIDAVFQSFILNILIHIGYYFLSKKEYKYPILESVIQMGYTVVLVLIAGEICGWYESMPLWCLFGMAIVVYVLGILCSAVSMLGDVREINALLDEH